MKKLLIICLLSLLTQISQAQVHSLYLNYGMGEDLKLNFKFHDQGIKFGKVLQDVYEIQRYAFGFESRHNNYSNFVATSLYWELAYIKGSQKSVEPMGNSPWRPNLKEDLSVYQFAVNYGITFARHCRFQVPLYLGIGANYYDADPLRHVTLSGQGKARAKLYLTRLIGVYYGVGANADMGLARDKKRNKYVDGPFKSNVHMLFTNWYQEAGVTITL